MNKENNSILYDVFVSYSRSDYKNEDGDIIPGNIISQIKKVLEENNISYWIDENGISNGDEFAKLIRPSWMSQVYEDDPLAEVHNRP